IRPKRSEAPSRSAIHLDRDYTFLNSGQTWQGVPLVASNMDTVGTMTMARALGPSLLTCLHKYYPDDALVEFFADERCRACTFFTIGIKDDEVAKLDGVMARVPLSLVCIDVANGYTNYFVNHVSRVRQAFPELTIMAGNVATPEMVQELL